MARKLNGQLGLGMDLDGTLNLVAGGDLSYLHALQQVAPNDGWSDWISFPFRDPGLADATLAISQPVLAIENLIDTQVLTAYFVGGRGGVCFQRKLPAWGDHPGRYPLAPGPLDTFGTVTAVGLIGQRPLDTLFAVQDTGRLYVIGGGVSSDWINLNSLPGAPTGIQFFLYPPCVAASLDGRLEVFGSGFDGQLYHLWETAVGGPWSHWFSHGVPAGFYLQPSPILGTNQDGRLELFVVGTASPPGGIRPGPLFHIWQTAPSNGWSTWFSHGNPANVEVLTAPAIARNADGRLDLFVVGVDGNLYEIRQIAPNDGWTDWLTIPAPPGTSLIPSPAVAPSRDGRLELFVVGADDNLYHRWQTDTTGTWSGWFSHGMP